jgi:hypothetical protein
MNTNPVFSPQWYECCDYKYQYVSKGLESLYVNRKPAPTLAFMPGYQDEYHPGLQPSMI